MSPGPSTRRLRIAVLASTFVAALGLTQAPALAAPPVASFGNDGSRAKVGHGPSSPTARIVGGNATTNEKYPWQALVLADGAQCGGSLIHPYIVLTAAHCLIGSDGKPRVVPGEVEVGLGQTELATGGDAHAAFDFYWHLGYNPSASEPESANDIAFVSLFSRSLRPRIQLAGPTERALWTPGRTNFVSGWGTTSEGGEVSEILKEAAVPIIDDGTCAQPGVYGSEFDPGTMVCAGYLGGGTDSCQGDSGGPLQSPIDGGGFRLTGIVSWGDGCAQPNSPGVYTRIGSEPLQSFVQEVVALIEANEPGIPDEFTGVNVIGSGARPLGCAAAEGAAAQAAAAAAAAEAAVPPAQQAAGATTGPLRKATKAKKSAQRAAKAKKRKNGTKAALRKANKRLSKARKKLKKAKGKAKAAQTRLAQVSTASASASSAAGASAAQKTSACG